MWEILSQKGQKKMLSDFMCFKIPRLTWQKPKAESPQQPVQVAYS